MAKNGLTIQDLWKQVISTPTPIKNKPLCILMVLSIFLQVLALVKPGYCFGAA